MTGLILYDRARMEKNRRFAQMLSDALRELSVTPVAALAEETDADDLDCDFVLRRCEAPEFSERVQERGIRVFNSAAVSRICNDKWATYELFRDSINICTTALAAEAPPFSFPCVVKSRTGHGGSEVFLAKNEEEYRQALGTCPDSIVQPFVPCGGRDVRVYVLGGRVLKAVKRTAREGFRSNFSLGGTAEEYFPDDAMREASEAVAHILDADFIGVDFLLTESGPLLNEVEDVVGTRMLYSLGLCDAARLLAQYAVNTISNRKQ